MTVMDLHPLADALPDAPPDALVRGEAAFCLLHEEGDVPLEEDECLEQYVSNVLDDVVAAREFAEKYGCAGVGTLFNENFIQYSEGEDPAPGEKFLHDVNFMQAEVWRQDGAWYKANQHKPLSEFVREALAKGWYDEPFEDSRDGIESGLATMGIERA